MKEILEQLSVYNLWANERIVKAVCSLPEEKLLTRIPSSFPSVHYTLLHMWDAESIWWQRLKLSENVIPPAKNFAGETRDIGAALLHQNMLWRNWVQAARPIAIDHVLLYKNSRQQQFKQPVYEILTHMFNHGTYHRGQIVTLLHHLDFQSIPATDFIVWSRTLKK